MLSPGALLRVVTTAGRALGRSVAFTRQGALTMASSMRSPAITSRAGRVAGLVVGCIVIGAGVASFSAAGLGLPPYDVLLNAIDRHTPLRHGQAGWVVALVLASLASLLGQRPTRATIAFVILSGISVDAAMEVVQPASGPGTRAVLVAMGTVGVASGVALVVFSGLTGGVFELWMAAGRARGLDPTKVRTVLELGSFGAGAIAGGSFGIATVVFALTIGPVIRLVVQGLDDHRVGRRLRLAVDTDAATGAGAVAGADVGAQVPSGPTVTQVRRPSPDGGSPRHEHRDARLAG